MAAQQYPKIPRVTVLQLDTSFPRIAGDVGAVQTYKTAPEILRISGASVGCIVTDTPQNINITPFAKAAKSARGDIVVTSCGFLSYWQNTLADAIEKPFVSSSLIALPHLANHFTPQELLILTFDAARLNTLHLHGMDEFAQSIIGLEPNTHLRAVIANDQPTLDFDTAQSEICALIERHQTLKTRAILLECTNLPPYKAQIRKITKLPVFDILSTLEWKIFGCVQPPFCGDPHPH